MTIRYLVVALLRLIVDDTVAAIARLLEPTRGVLTKFTAASVQVSR